MTIQTDQRIPLPELVRRITAVRAELRARRQRAIIRGEYQPREEQPCQKCAGLPRRQRGARR